MNLGQRKTILMIDDSGSMRTVVKLALQKVGYRVVEAADGQEATTWLDTVPPDLIVCDLDMSHLDGLDFTRHVKTLDHHRFTPVVMITSESHNGRKAEGRAAGVRAWITKPFQPAHLVDVVARLCP